MTYHFDPVNGAHCGQCQDVALFRSGGAHPGWWCTTCRRELTVAEIARSAATVLTVPDAPLTSSVSMESFETICEERDALHDRLQQWRSLDPILAEMQAESDAVDEEAERNSIVSPEYERRLRLLGLTARHFLRERANLHPSTNAIDPSAQPSGTP